MTKQKLRTHKHKSIYLTPEEYKTVREKLAGSGVCFSAFARSLLSSKKLINKRSIPVEQFRELSAIGNNLNQLARVANQSKELPENLSGIFLQLKSQLLNIQEALK